MTKRCVARSVSLTLLLATFAGCNSERQQSGSPDPVAPSSTTAHRENTTEVVPVESHMRFVEMTSKAELEFRYRNGEEAGEFAILESLGGGVACVDYDVDGRIDLFFTGGGTFEGGSVVGLPSSLMRNDGAWRFKAVGGDAGAVNARHYSHGAAAADLDQDGFTDLIATGYGGLQLLYNRGDGTFEDATDRAGLVETLWSSSAAVGDVNGDSIPDLYVAHYVDWSPDNNPVCTAETGERDVCPPRRFEGLTDAIYFGNGDLTFRDASDEAGLTTGGKGLGVVMADLDLDSDLDLYVTNDTVDNFLYENDGRGHFSEVGAGSGTAFNDRGRPDGSMGVDVGDYNLDGLPDLWVANYELESFALYRNEGRLLFQHVSRAAGVTAGTGKSVGWGTVFFDADRDGDLDLFVSNGHVIKHPRHSPVSQSPLLFENGEGEYRNVAPAVGGYFSAAHNGRGAAVSDLDGDGTLDLAVSRVNAPVAILRNNTPGGEWISLRLIGTNSSRDAVGAVVTVEAVGLRQVRQIIGGGSYASTSDPRLFFGLNDTDRVTVTVRWPNDLTSRYELAAGRSYQLIEPGESGRQRVPLSGTPSAAIAASASRAPA